MLISDSPSYPKISGVLRCGAGLVGRERLLAPSSSSSPLAKIRVLPVLWETAARAGSYCDDAVTRGESGVRRGALLDRDAPSFPLLRVGLVFWEMRKVLVLLLAIALCPVACATYREDL